MVVLRSSVSSPTFSRHIVCRRVTFPCASSACSGNVCFARSIQTIVILLMNSPSRM